MLPIFIDAALLAGAAVVIAVVYRLWLRLLNDAGPAAVATTLTVFVLIVAALLFTTIEYGGAGLQAFSLSD